MVQLKILPWLYKSKVNARGLAPIYLRITKGNQRTELSTGFYCRPADWNTVTHSVKLVASHAKEINDNIYVLLTKIHMLYNELLRSGTTFHISVLKNTLLGKNQKQATLMEAIHYHNELVRKGIGRNYALGTYKAYVWFRDKVKSFLKYQYDRTDILLNELNHKFMTEFEHYLYHILNNKVNTVQKNITQLKKIINLCLDLDWLDKMPFKRISKKPYTPQRDFLNKEELEVLQRLDISNKRLQTIRDKFIFQCYTGIAFIDLNKLTADEVVKGIDGEDWIIINRQKTKTRATIPLLPVARDLICQYKDPKRTTLFPTCSNQKFNQYLKELIKLCNIKKRVSTHTGRRTFATTVTLSNGVPIETVSRMLGHSDLKTTAIYAKVVDRKVSDDMSSLRKRLGNSDKVKETSPSSMDILGSGT